MWKTLRITDKADNAPSTAVFDFADLDGGGIPENDAEVTIEIDAVRIFGGYLTKKSPKRIGSDFAEVSFQCLDYTRDLDRRLVVESYTGMTDKEIIEDIVSRYCGGTGITTTNVLENDTIEQLTFNYKSASQCINDIANLTGQSWYIDYYKDIHFFPLTNSPAPFNITTSSANYKDLKINADNAGIKNRVYVRGGSYLSDPITINFKADGVQTVFFLPEKAHDVSVTDNGSSKTVGIKNIDPDGSSDYLLNYQEKYLEAHTAPTSGHTIAITFTYLIPILIAVQDDDSIAEVGPFEFAIFDNNITTKQQARDRANAEITDFKNALVDGSFITTTPGFFGGQYLNINLPDIGVNADYLVQSVQMNALGGGTFEYTVSFASSQKIGMLQFLVNMIEANKSTLNITSDEVVDELFPVAGESTSVTPGTPSLTSDTPPFTWGTAKWGLSEWS